MNAALLVLLAASALIDLALGAWAGAGWPSFASFWFKNTPVAGDGPLRLLGLVLAFMLLFFAALQVLAGLWTRRDRAEGRILAGAFGAYLVISSLVTYLVFQNATFVTPILFPLVDGIRGAALVALSWLAMNEPATVRTLRLPDGHRVEGSRRGQERRGRDRDERRQRRDRRDRNGARRGGSGKGDRPRGSKAKDPSAGSTPDPGTDRSLAVVVRGDFKQRPGEGDEADARGRSSSRGGRRDRRPRRGPSAEGSDAGAPEAPAESGRPEGDRDGRRRRRRRRGGPDRGASPATEESGGAPAGPDAFGRTRRADRPHRDPDLADTVRDIGPLDD